MNSIIIGLAFILLALASPPCTPSYLLDQILHDSVNIIQFNTSTSLTQSTYTYNYFQNLFKEKPSAIISISELLTSKMSNLNYEIKVQLQTKSLNFQFSSKNMSWISVEIQFLIHSRNDIFSNIHTINLFGAQKNSTAQYQVSNSNSASFIFTHFIIGVATNSQSTSYSIGIQPFNIQAGQYQITAFSNIQGTLTIQTIYFDAKISSFSYSFNEFTFEISKDAQYKSFWADFAPTIYRLFGFSNFKLSKNQLGISSSLDILNSLITVDKMNGVSSANFQYLIIGRKAKQVCSPCNTFISISGCLEDCPNNSYSEILTDGGKTCRFCNQKLGLVLSYNSLTCTCINGLNYFQGNCYKKQQLPPICGKDTVLIRHQCVNISPNTVCKENQVYDLKNSSCICRSNYERYQTFCVKICPAYSIRDSNGICSCIAGYLMNNLYECISICPSNSFYDMKAANCICNRNYQMMKGSCVICNKNQQYDEKSKSCVAKQTVKIGTTNSIITITCKINEAIVNNMCQCDQHSIKKGNQCVQCPPATYKVDKSNLCANCTEYCVNCNDRTKCSQCTTGFQASGSICSQICGDGKKFILPCDDGNTKSGDGCSSSCQIENGYVCTGGNKDHPDVCTKLKQNTKMSVSIGKAGSTYVASGIITDLIVKPPIRRTREDLYSIFKITFSSPKAAPKSIMISQNQIDPGSIRCYFSYNNDLPNVIFQAFFTVFDEDYGSDSLTLMYNSISNKLKSSIAYLNEQSDADIIY